MKSGRVFYEIAADAVPEVHCFADIYDSGPGVLHEIDSGSGGKLLQADVNS
jgi:hypothetical protein